MGPASKAARHREHIRTGSGHARAGSLKETRNQHTADNGDRSQCPALPSFERSWLLPVFQLSACGFALLNVVPLAESAAEIIVVVVWHAMLWLQALVILHGDFVPAGRPKLAAASIVAIVTATIPTLQIMHRVRMISAVHAAASVFTGARAIQLALSPQPNWGRWQVHAAFCGWGWHDMRTAKPLAAQAKRKALMSHTGVLLGFAALGAVCRMYLVWTLSSGEAHVILSRYFAGGVMIVSMFKVIDAMVMAL